MADQRHEGGGPDAAGGPFVAAAFNGRFDRFLHECAETIVGCAGGDLTRCLFLCGSFATGEGSVDLTSGSPLLLSDVDLVLVVDTIEAHRTVYPTRRRLAAACEARFPEARFAGHVDVGVMLSGELGSLRLSPGVFDMRTAGRVLFGDASVLGRLPDPDPGAIGAGEARLLCENRMASLLGAAQLVREDSSTGSPELRYAISRVYTDIGTAELCAAGAYRTGYAERLRWLSGDPRAASVRKNLGEPVIDAIARWTAYKLCPSPEAAPAGNPAALWLEAAGRILTAWKRATAAGAGLEPGSAVSRPVGELIPLRPRCGSARAALRRWREYLRADAERSSPSALALALARFRGGSPDDRVRLEAIRLIDAAIGSGTGRRIDRPPRGFPHGGGPWPEAARATHLAWDRLVHGRDA